jgi:hypothetical protein
VDVLDYLLSMSRTVGLTEGSFFSFVSKESVSVVFLAAHRAHAFNEALLEQISRMVGPVPFGCLTLTELSISHSAALEFLASVKGKEQTAAVVVPGYYLFRGNKLLAHDLGLPCASEFPRLLRKALRAVAFPRWGESSGLAHSLFVAANQVAAPRIARRFVEAMRASQDETARTRERVPSPEELHWAYGALGVRDRDTEATVNEAWRQLRALNYPDHALGDTLEVQRRTVISRDLNRARDVIRAHRRWACTL